MKNKRGFAFAIPLVAWIVGLVLSAILILIAFFVLGSFIKNNIWMISGVAVLAITLFTVLPVLVKNPSQEVGVVFALLIIFAIALMAVPIIEEATGFSIVGTSTFVKPSWARLECAPTDAYEKTFGPKWLDQQTVFKCDGFTEECRVTIEHTGSSFFDFSYTGDYKECNLDGVSGCSGKRTIVGVEGLKRGDKKVLPMLPSGRSYVFDSGFFVSGENHAAVTVTWKPWKLYRFVGGAKWIVNSYSCDVVSSAKAKIRQEDYTSRLYRQGGEGTKWINYVDDWNYGPPTNVFTHQQYGEVYCSAAQIYDIVELKMSDGKLKKVEPGYSQTLPNGDRLSGLGTKLANVDCCPNEPGCDQNFEYIPEPEEKECFSDIQCFNGGGPVPTDGTHYVKYQCIQDKCRVSGEIQVECTTTAQCAGTQICDLSTTNYGKCIGQTNNDYCGDGICSINENSNICSADCGIAGDGVDKQECEDDDGLYVPGKTTEKGKGWFGIGKWFGLTDETTEPSRCLISHASVTAILILLGGIGLLIFGITKQMPLVIIPSSLMILVGLIWTALAGAGYV